MKSSFILLLLLSIAFVGNAQNKVDAQGRRQGHWVRTDSDGSRIFEGEYRNGLEIDTFLYYYPNGNLRMRNVFLVPGRFCTHQAFDEQGHLLASGFYNQKNRDSVWHFYNEQGRLVKIASYNMGVKQGIHVVFDANGDTAEVAGWLDNHRHGRWWRKLDGKGYISCNYVNGLTQGALREYDSDGTLAREAFYKDGAKHGDCRIFEKGVLSVVEKWQAGFLVERKILLNSPQPSWHSVFAIAYFLPKGSSGTYVYLNDGTRLVCTDSFDIVNERVAADLFLLVDRKNRLMCNRNAIIGISKDDEGRDILQLDPQPPFTVFPDAECVKMVQSLQRIDELDR